MPQQQADHDRRDQREDQVGLAEVTSLEPPGLLHLADPQRPDHANQHEHAEDVDEQRVPALVTEPGQRVVLVDDADQRDQDRREEHREAPEDERVQQPRAESLEQLALTEDDLRLVAGAAGYVALAIGRGRPLYESGEEANAGEEQRPAQSEGHGERERGDQRGYPPPLVLRISAEIAGTTSWRSPITA